MRSRIKTWSFPLLLSQHFLKKQKKKRFAFPPAFCGMWFCENGFADLLALCAKVASPPPRRGSNGFSIWSVIKSRSWNKRYQVTGWPPRRVFLYFRDGFEGKERSKGGCGAHPQCPHPSWVPSGCCERSPGISSLPSHCKWTHIQLNPNHGKPPLVSLLHIGLLYTGSQLGTDNLTPSR